MSQLPLRGSAVLLREFRPDDADAVFAVIGDDRVTRFLSFDSRDRAAADAMIEGVAERAARSPRAEYYLGVALLGTPDVVVGFCRLALSGVNTAKIGYAVAADHWGKGLATDAVTTMLNFAFEDLGLHRVTAAIGPDNDASRRVVEKLGFTREGRLRDHVYTNGAWRDSVLFSILSDEWVGAGRACR
uniref:GNAT family N-acetyltransferase n=1 Tax=Amycolatopsis sp. CA-096443 TaxID=3239919 RepID=UPI003F4988D4